MGTRSLTAVYLDGEYAVAQYGHWDGYPSRLGVGLLEFLQDVNLNELKIALHTGVSFHTEDEIKEIRYILPDAHKKYPYLSYDYGAELMRHILHSEYTTLVDSLEFAADSVFCEWAYVIDLDKGTFEVYEGFNTNPLTLEDRFFHLSDKTPSHKTDKYYPVKLKYSFDLDNLPDVDEFLRKVDEEVLDWRI